MKKISMVVLSMILTISLAAVPAIAAEETEVRIVASEELTENAEPEVKTVAEETTVIEKDAENKKEASVIEQAAEKVQEVIEEVIETVKETAETVKETAETVKENIEEIREKAEEEAVHAQMEIDANIPEEDEEYYNVSTVVFTEDGMLILPRPVKEGKVFIEWNTEEDGSGYGYKAGEIVDPTDIVLYSIWEDEVKEEELKAEEVQAEEEIVNDIEAEAEPIKEDAEIKEEVKAEEVKEEEVIAEEVQEEVAEGEDEAKEETGEPEGAVSEDTVEPEGKASEEGEAE